MCVTRCAAAAYPIHMADALPRCRRRRATDAEIAVTWATCDCLDAARQSDDAPRWKNPAPIAVLPEAPAPHGWRFAAESAPQPPSTSQAAGGVGGGARAAASGRVWTYRRSCLGGLCRGARTAPVAGATCWPPLAHQRRPHKPSSAAALINSAPWRDEPQAPFATVAGCPTRAAIARRQSRRCKASTPTCK